LNGPLGASAALAGARSGSRRPAAKAAAVPRASRRLLGRSAIITAPWPALRCARAGADRGAAGRNAAAGPAIAAKIRRERRIVSYVSMDSLSVAGSWFWS